MELRPRGAALSTGLVVDPVAGLAAYVAAHAVQYTVVVHGTLAARYGLRTARPAGPAGVLARVASTATGRAALLTGVLGLLALADVGLRGIVRDSTYLIALYTIGLLHFVYDAVIWRDAQAQNRSVPRHRRVTEAPPGPITAPPTTAAPRRRAGCAGCRP